MTFILPLREESTPVTTGMIPDTKPPARKREMAASSSGYKKTQFILKFVWEGPQAQRGGGAFLSRRPRYLPSLAAEGEAGGDLGGDTVVLVFGCGFVFKRSYIRLDGFPSRPVSPGTRELDLVVPRTRLRLC